MMEMKMMTRKKMKRKVVNGDCIVGYLNICWQHCVEHEPPRLRGCVMLAAVRQIVCQSLNVQLRAKSAQMQ